MGGGGGGDSWTIHDMHARTHAHLELHVVEPASPQMCFHGVAVWLKGQRHHFADGHYWRGGLLLFEAAPLYGRRPSPMDILEGCSMYIVLSHHFAAAFMLQSAVFSILC